MSVSRIRAMLCDPRSVQRLTALLLGAVLAGCSHSPSAEPPGATDVELQVAAWALSEFAGKPDSNGVLRLHSRLQARTAEFPDSAAWTATIDGFGLERTRYPTLVASYWQANRHARPLDDVLQVPGWRVQLVDTLTGPSPDDEPIYYASRAGFAPTGDSVLVAVDELCGPLCGRGVLVLYVRKQDGWHLASTLQLLQY
jgi:hypothetical protein